MDERQGERHRLRYNLGRWIHDKAQSSKRGDWSLLHHSCFLVVNALLFVNGTLLAWNLNDKVCRCQAVRTWNKNGRTDEEITHCIVVIKYPGVFNGVKKCSVYNPEPKIMSLELKVKLV
ncbi:hypothetical protein K439DRAFT_1637666 [Ramaria rubella]|nr:hypothetical protein K439DRAFT_1637666 [Ramaria rubella]